MTVPQTLLLRADASVRMGTGHVMRCLALAQAWRDNGDGVILASTELPAPLRDRLQAEGIELATLKQKAGSDADAQETAALASRRGAAWMVLDGYQFGTAYHERLNQGRVPLLVVDDLAHAEFYCCDIVLNQNLHAHESRYRQRRADTRLLLGPRYALLRHEFRAYAGWTRPIPARGRKVLVTLGGSDPDNATAKVVRALRQLGPEIEADIVIGGANPYRQQLEALVHGHETRLRLRRNVAAMAERMAWADVAMAAGGTTSWERACLGLPGLVFELADNQRDIVETIAKRELCVALGRPESISVDEIARALDALLKNPERRAAMARRGAELVDGQGSLRVVTALRGMQGDSDASSVSR